MFDWYRRCSYDAEQKKQFHRHARAALRALAKELRFESASFEIRSNVGGIAVSGEITLHHHRVYIQVCQPATGADSGVLIRTCEGKRDYTGGRESLRGAVAARRSKGLGGLCARGDERGPFAHQPDVRPAGGEAIGARVNGRKRKRALPGGRAREA